LRQLVMRFDLKPFDSICDFQMTLLSQ